MRLQQDYLKMIRILTSQKKSTWKNLESLHL